MKTKNVFLPLLIALAASACGHNGISNNDSAKPNQTSTETNTSMTDISVRNLASALPDQLVAMCKFKQPPVPYSLEDDDGSMVTGLMANIAQTVYSVPVNDFLNLKKASSHWFLSPVLRGCNLTTDSFDYVGPANVILNFGGRDAKGTSNCQDFMKSIGQKGLQMQFTNVPLLNHPGTIIKMVIINIRNP
jgi:hypothetical protein